MTAAFVFELIRAANETDRLTKPERARLLERAAATLREYRRAINYSETPANDRGPGDAASEWTEMARLIEMFTPTEVASAFLDAADAIKAARVLLEIKEDIETEGSVS